MAEQAKAKTAPDQKGKPKHRSPNYPVISLRKAIERIEVMYGQYKRFPVRAGVVHESWGFKADSGAGNQTVAALRSYGLVDVVGDGSARQLKLSERGYLIVENHRDRQELLKAAALGPAIHSEVWKEYDGQLPPDTILRDYLKFKRSFNPDSIDGFIARFRETIQFAGLDSSDKIPESPAANADELSDDGSGEDETNGVKMNPPAAATLPKSSPPAPPVGQKPFPLYLTNNQQGVMYVPAPMTPHDYALLKTQIESSLATIGAALVNPPVDPKTGKPMEQPKN